MDEETEIFAGFDNFDFGWLTDFTDWVGTEKNKS
jgi:hypothetical protein